MTNVLRNKKGEPIKIALIGGARTGKDTIGYYLTTVYGFDRHAFADALRDNLSRVFPDLPLEPKPRDAMIKYGQLCREIDPLVWIKHLHKKTSDVTYAFGLENFVITDVRQQNEIDYCIEQGYTLVKVVADRETVIDRALQCGAVLDVDNELDKLALAYDGLTIENNGDLDHLYKQVDFLIDVLQG